MRLPVSLIQKLGMLRRRSEGEELPVGAEPPIVEPPVNVEDPLAGDGLAVGEDVLTASGW